MAITTMQLPRSRSGRDRPALVDKRGPDRHAIDREPLQQAEVGQGQDAEAGAIDLPRGVADSALQLECDHAHAGSDDPTGRSRRSAAGPGSTRIAGRRLGIVQGRPDIGRLDLDRPRCVQVAVVALGHDGHEGIEQAGLGNALDERLDRGVVHPSDRHRRGQQDRRLDQPPFIDRADPDHLPRPVQDSRPGGDAVQEELGRTERDDRGHAGPGDAPAGRWRGLVAPDRAMPDGDPGNVHDRVRRPRVETPDPKPELARAGAGGRGGGRGMGCGRRRHPPSMPFARRPRPPARLTVRPKAQSVVPARRNPLRKPR